MTPLIMILLPLVFAAQTYALRHDRNVGLNIGLATLIVELIFLLRIPNSGPAHIFGLSLALDGSGRVLLYALMLALASVFVAWMSLPASKNAAPITLLLLSFGLGAVLIQSVAPAALMVLMAAGVGVLLLVDAPSDAHTLLTPRAIASAIARLVLVVVGTLLMLMGYVLEQAGAGGAVFSIMLMYAGLSLWLGLVPLHFSLADIADDTSMPLFVCIVVVVQAAMVTVFEHIAQPDRLAGAGRMAAFIAIGLTLVAAPLLARGTAPRAIALTLLANLGQVVLGTVLGVAVPGGKLTLLAAHVVAATLICSSAALLEIHVPGQPESPTPWRDRPIAAAGLIAGLLMLVGIPGLGGFAGKLALWRRVVEEGPLAVGILGVGTVLLVYTAAQIARGLLLTSAERREAERREHWRRRVAPRSGSSDEIATLPVVVQPYVPPMLRAWTVCLIVVAVATAIDTFLPS